MIEKAYWEKLRDINNLLQITELKIKCFSPSFKLVKSVDNIEKAIEFASSDIKNKYSRLKDVSIEIEEINFIYYSAFSPLDFTDNLIKKLENYILEKRKSFFQP